MPMPIGRNPAQHLPSRGVQGLFCGEPRLETVIAMPLQHNCPDHGYLDLLTGLEGKDDDEDCGRQASDVIFWR